MIPAPFDYVRPGTIDEALEALERLDAKAIAGGHSLVPLMKLRLVRPALLVDLAGLDFRGVRADGGGIAIGALTTYNELTGGGWTVRLPDALLECADSVGDVQVRNAGTIGGSIAHGDPASDLAAAVLALEATLRLRSTSGTREVAASDFFLGPYATALAEQELLTEIVLPEPGEGTGSAYVSLEDTASGYPIVGAAAVLRMEGDGLAACAVGLTGSWARPCRAEALEEALLSDGIGRAEVAPGLLPEVEIGADDAELAYRRHVAAVIAGRALRRAAERAARGEAG